MRQLLNKECMNIAGGDATDTTTAPVTATPSTTTTPTTSSPLDINDVLGAVKDLIGQITTLIDDHANSNSGHSGHGHKDKKHDDKGHHKH